MSMNWFLLAMLAGLQLKHFVADYVLQPAWMISGKGDLRRPGGYVHAGIHALATMPILWCLALDTMMISALAAGEFLVHFLIDHLKATHSRRHPHSMHTRSFWVLHGADQLAHHLTYSALLLVSTSSTMMK